MSEYIYKQFSECRVSYCRGGGISSMPPSLPDFNFIINFKQSLTAVGQTPIKFNLREATTGMLRLLSALHASVYYPIKVL